MISNFVTERNNVKKKKMAKKNKTLTDFSKNKENPFLRQTIVNLGKYLGRSMQMGQAEEEKAVLKAVDDDGEILGNTVFVQNKVVDRETFAKVFYSGFAAFSGMKPSFMKVFQYIIEQLHKDTDKFYLYIDDVVKKTGLSKMTIYRALGNLCEREIIARGRTEYEYFINPMFVFNGSRVTFVNNWINSNALEEYHTGNRKGLGLSASIKRMQQNGLLPSSAETEKKTTENLAEKLRQEFEATMPNIAPAEAEETYPMEAWETMTAEDLEKRGFVVGNPPKKNMLRSE